MSAKFIAIFLLLSTITGCAFSPPKPTAKLVTDRSSKEVASFIEENASKCWSREATNFINGILVDGRKIGNNAYIITANGYTPTRAFKPFLIIEIRENHGSGSEILVNEGTFSCSLTGSCDNLNLTRDIEHWAKSQDSCSIEKNKFF